MNTDELANPAPAALAASDSTSELTETVPLSGSRRPAGPVSPDAVFVRRLRSGDAEAGYWFVRDHYPRIFHYLLYLTGRREAAEDLTQETFLQAWRRLETFDERLALGPWLCQIARREFLQALRRRPSEAFLGDIAEVAALQTGLETDAVELRAILGKLPRQQREIVVLHALEGYTSEEIARIVGLPAGTVRYRLSQARVRLRVELGEGDLLYLNEPSMPMRQWAWLPLDQMHALETRLVRRGPGARTEDEMERREFLRHAAVGAAGLMLPETEKEVVDDRLTQKATCAFKGTALSDLCAKLKSDTGIPVTAGPSVADEKVTLFCEKTPLREVMRQLSRPFGYTWLRSGTPGQYRYELVQDLRSQLLEEELRNRDRNAALLALDQEIEKYRPYLGLSPDEALARAQRAPAEEKPLLEKFADVGWAPIQMYFRLSPQELAMLRAGQELVFTEDPKPGERRLPADLRRGVLESNRYYRIIRQADRLRVTTDVNLPEALPLTDVPEVKAQLDISIPEIEPGQFELRGHAGALMEPGPKTGRGWSNFEGRPPYAVGRGPSYSSGATERTVAPDPRDPALRAPVTLRPQPSAFAPQPSAADQGNAAPEPKVTTADVLEALHRATGVPIVADFYTRLYERKQVSAENQPLSVLLDQLGATMRLRWRLDGDSAGAGARSAGPVPGREAGHGATASGAEKRWLQFRSATYYQDRLKEVPNRLLTRWAASRRRHAPGSGPALRAPAHEVGGGGLPFDDLVEIAGLSDAQLDGAEMREGAVEWWGIPEWSLLCDRDFRPHIRFLAQFTPEQRQMMTSAEGLPFGKMSLTQQQGFLSQAIKGESIRSWDELAGATLRVDYTQPGAFQWQKPGGFTPSRWVVRVEPGPAGRRILMPPIRERTREAALAAARRAFPPVTPALLAAFQQADTQIEADQILPQPGQIFPTELDLVVVYIPGVVTERGIRWFRIGQGPLVGDGA